MLMANDEKNMRANMNKIRFMSQIELVWNNSVVFGCGLTFLRNKLDEVTFDSDRKRVIVALSRWSASEKQPKTADNVCIMKIRSLAYKRL